MMKELTQLLDLRTDVLIVGAGPAGMTMALALSQFGVKTTIVERRATIAVDPRAHALNSRTLEIFSAIGVDIGELQKAATPSEQSNWVRWVDRLNGSEYGALPYERMQADEELPTPWPLFNISHPNAEKVLEDCVQKAGGVKLLRGWQWESCVQDDAGAVCTVTDAQGNERKISSRFVIAADGAGSRLRTSLGINMEGLGVMQHFKNVHFKADLSHIAGGKPAILYWVLDQKCPGTFIAYDMHDNWVFMHPYDANQVSEDQFSDEHCLQMVRDAIGEQDIDIEVISIGNWVMSSEIAASYRSNNVFLIGDAAHRYPPSGGLGLNTGVGDAHNLAWKMAGVLNGWTGSELLDSYESERKKVAQNNAEFSVVNAGKMLDVFLATGTLDAPGEQPAISELQADEQKWNAVQTSIEAQRVHFDGLALHIGAHYGRDESPDVHSAVVQHTDVGARLPHAWVEKNGNTVSSLDLLSATAFTLIASAGFDTDSFGADVPYQIRREGIDFRANRTALETLGLGDEVAILVRPDGHIGARLIKAQDGIETESGTLVSAVAA